MCNNLRCKIFARFLAKLPFFCREFRINIELINTRFTPFYVFAISNTPSISLRRFIDHLKSQLVLIASLSRLQDAVPLRYMPFNRLESRSLGELDWQHEQSFSSDGFIEFI